MTKRISDVAHVVQGLAVSGRGAGARRGDWELRLVESADISDGYLQLDGPRTISIERNARTEKHPLRPFDVLVTARSHTVKSALVPPGVSRTVAGVTLLVVRPRNPGSGMGHWLWYFLASTHGRARLAKRVTVSASIASMSARNLGEVEVPVPPPRELDRIARLVEVSEAAHAAALKAARLRRETLRDSLIHHISRKPVSAT